MPLEQFYYSPDMATSAVSMRQALDRDGAILIRDVLSAGEIETAREQVRSHLTSRGRRLSLGLTQPNAAILAPEINWIVGHERITAVFRALLDKAVFTGHCDIHMNMLSGWHKDSGEHVGGYFQGDYFVDEDCQVFKAAVYLQDAGRRDGLTVRLRSHRSMSHGGEEVWIPSRQGDVVIFDVRLSHTGQRPDIIELGMKAATKTFKDRSGQDQQWLTSLKSAYWGIIGRRDRLSLFFTFGEDNRFTEQFAEANMLRQNHQAGTLAAEVDTALTGALTRHGIRIHGFRDIIG